MSYDYLLNKVTLKDGRELLGIVDFITKKQLYFFDFTDNHTIDYVTLCILWRGNNPDMRFSVYFTVNYPDLKLPKVILIPQNNIEKLSGKLPDHKKSKQRKRIIKIL